MAKAMTYLDIKTLASQVGVSVALLRKWIWKLDIVPVKRVERTFTTAKGKRIGLVALYDGRLVKTLKGALK